MKELSIDLKNCFGIKSLEYKFDFGDAANRKKSFAIYAPNGLMKTSFTKTFERLAQGKEPVEERFNRAAQATVLIDGAPINQNAIYVLKSEIDLSQESPEISNILVNPDKKKRYDTLVLNIDKQKGKAISSLQKLSGVPKNDIEAKILEDVGEKDFVSCLAVLHDGSGVSENLPYSYGTVFDQKVIDLLKNPDFLENAKEFSERYQEIFKQEGTIFKKDVFNPIRAERSFETLKTQGYFECGHLLYLNGDSSPVGVAEAEGRVKALLNKIESDQRLNSIKQSIAKNAQTQAIAGLFESLGVNEIEALLNGLKEENQKGFKRFFWKNYINACKESPLYLELHANAKDELELIEQEAASLAPEWASAVELFNSRFTEMPFRLEVENQVKAALGKEQAKLSYVFKDDGAEVRLRRNELMTLSQGEKRALYLLNFIFEIEARSKLGHETVFIIDDAADSFDYKNKHAIIQYLEDIESKPNVYQIILTHNYDFFRGVAAKFVHRKKCLMANKHPSKIELEEAQGVKNYFTGILCKRFNACRRAMCASIPFARNIIEYTKGEGDPDYLLLTSLLHQKQNTDTITHQNFVDVYNAAFGCNHVGTNATIKSIIIGEADAISLNPVQTGLNLEDKVVMSMAIRLLAEKYMLDQIRVVLNDQNYWCNDHSQFGKLLGKYSQLLPASPAIPVLRKVSVTVSSNIHLNSFMYEPILDLSIGHLAELYNEVKAL